MTEVRMPKIGLSEAPVKLICWTKQPGDEVRFGETMAEIHGEKLTGEIESPATGRVSKLLAAAGDEVPVAEVVAYIESE